MLNPLPHGVLATFSLTAGGPIGPPKKDDISREKAIMMTSLRTYRTSAVRREGLHCKHPPPLTQCYGEATVYTYKETKVFVPTSVATLPRCLNKKMFNSMYDKQQYFGSKIN